MQNGWENKKNALKILVYKLKRRVPLVHLETDV
jgi:hypothetical protein